MIRYLARIIRPVRMIHVWITKLALVIGILSLTLWLDDLFEGPVWQISVDLVAVFLGTFVLVFPIVPAKDGRGLRKGPDAA